MTKPYALIVEDQADLAEIFSTAMEKAGYEVTAVPDGETAVHILQEHPPFVILLDLHLPKKSGVDVLRIIRRDEALSDTRIILISADMRRAIELEDAVTCVLVKPIEFGQLVRLGRRMKPTAENTQVSNRTTNP